MQQPSMHSRITQGLIYSTIFPYHVFFSQIANFRAIPYTDGSVPQLIENLSTDEKYLFEIANAVSTGVCSLALANKLPGAVHHARWITKASRYSHLHN